MTRRSLLKSLLMAPLAAIVGAKIPQSFKDGLADCEAGRVTQMTDEAFTTGGVEILPPIWFWYFENQRGQRHMAYSDNEIMPGFWPQELDRSWQSGTGWRVTIGHAGSEEWCRFTENNHSVPTWC